MATISAQPILRPFLFQPGQSLQKSHCPPKTTPIPHDEEASTQNSIWEAVGGLERVEPQNGADSWTCHQSMSESTLVFSCLWA